MLSASGFPIQGGLSRYAAFGMPPISDPPILVAPPVKTLARLSHENLDESCGARTRRAAPPLMATPRYDRVSGPQPRVESLDTARVDACATIAGRVVRIAD
jgi:hypothetical protein